jgi:hypothetical protein
VKIELPGQSDREKKLPALGTALGLLLVVILGLNGALADQAPTSNAASPLVQTMEVIGQWDTTGNAHDGVYVQGNYAYLSDWDRGLDIVEITNPAAPVLRANLPLAYKRGLDVLVEGSYAYVLMKYSGLRIVNISNPAAPTEVGSIMVPPPAQENALRLCKAGNYVYVADEGQQVRVYNVSNPASPTLAGIIPSGYANAVYVAGNLAYVVGLGDPKFQIYDISNPAAPQYRGGLATCTYPWDVQVVGAYAYIADDSAGLRVVDVSNPQTPVQVNLIATTGEAYSLRIAEGFAYVASNTKSGVGATGPGYAQVFALSDPTTPLLAGSYVSTSRIEDVYPAGGRAYAAAFDHGLLVLDASFTQLPTATPTITLTPTVTRTPTQTATPTRTATPTATPDPRFTMDLTVQVTLQGRGSAPSAAWAVPLTVSLTGPNGGVLQHTYGGTSSREGALGLTGVHQGTFDVLVTSHSSLANRWQAIGLSAGSLLLDMQTLYEGDTNQDGRINILDFARLASSYGASVGQAGYEASADLNSDGFINILDFALLASNYGLEGPRDVAP